ncbi:MAG TPA: glutamate-5-semialdehyde dehydrogenase [Treponemataceae bacterium]|nr:glutamate-5-semialdehyde dehydrogenase [Treponemataceae bacterium]HPS43780.1 glutamate-5-semialdehyde dehydrogenase [Treponemataceae bacterium]
MDLDSVCSTLRQASGRLALCTAEEKNRALLGVAESLDSAREGIFAANALDVARARAGGMTEALIARLALTPKSLDEIVSSLRELVAQTDPIGQVVAGWTVPNGLEIRQVRVPLGVAAVIYESRPNVTVDAFALAYKSSNAVLLRGSSSALDSNRVILKAIKAGLESSGGVVDAVALSEPGEGADSHADVDWILGAVGKIDVALPRGGTALIKHVVETARVPVIETGSGVCHVYVDSSADGKMAVSIAENAKIQKPAACNALECILVHRDRAASVLPALRDAFAKYERKTGRSGGVELRCDARAFDILAAGNNTAAGKDYRPANVIRAEEGDWGREFLDYVLAVKVVDSLDEAIAHVNRYGTKHSETIVTEDRENARAFQRRIDSACVYVNASTRFTDGGQFGMGAELGISTQKLHARGPMGLTALTTTKFLIEGEGQVRP